MTLTPEELRKIDETHDTVIKLKTVLLGANGNPGLVDQVLANTKRSSRNTIILTAIIASGGLSGGVFGIIKLLT